MYSIVLFVEEGNGGVISLVPSSWISNCKLFCKWPVGQPDSLIKSAIKPNSKWKSHRIKIIDEGIGKYVNKHSLSTILFMLVDTLLYIIIDINKSNLISDSYEKGKRHEKRAEDNQQLQTTDTELPKLSGKKRKKSTVTKRKPRKHSSGLANISASSSDDSSSIPSSHYPSDYEPIISDNELAGTEQLQISSYDSMDVFPLLLIAMFH